MFLPDLLGVPGMLYLAPESSCPVPLVPSADCYEQLLLTGVTRVMNSGDLPRGSHEVTLSVTQVLAWKAGQASAPGHLSTPCSLVLVLPAEEQGPQSSSSQEFLTVGRKAISSTCSDTQA